MPPLAPLFFYGVLRDGVVSGRMAELVSLLDPARPATAQGRLFALKDRGGSYPIMLAGVGNPVHGAVRRPGVRFGAGELAELDQFEGSEYDRHDVAITLADGSPAVAQAYVWNRVLPGDAVALPHGDFARYLRESGEVALPG